jgi:hypothetical protein
MAALLAADWGDVPTWLGAVGTVAAAWIALVIYAQSQRDRKRSQARSVSGWVPGGPSLVPAGMQIGASPFVAQQDRVELQVWIHNRSGEIISDVSARVVSADGEDLGVEGLKWTDIGPGQTIELGHSQPDDGSIRGELRLKVEFTDAAGRRWERVGSSLRRHRRFWPPRWF